MAGSPSSTALFSSSAKTTSASALTSTEATLALGIRDVRDLPMVTDAMLRRGYSEERIRKFWGGNLLRVFRQITS
jgi:microsomal dipeptidase-like Zn-dependent dipeptidase